MSQAPGRFLRRCGAVTVGLVLLLGAPTAALAAPGKQADRGPDRNGPAFSATTTRGPSVPARIGSGDRDRRPDRATNARPRNTGKASPSAMRPTNRPSAAGKPARSAGKPAKAATSSAPKRPSAARGPAPQAAPQARAATAKRPSARGPAPQAAPQAKAASVRGAEASASRGRPAHAGKGAEKGTVAAASVGPVHAEFQVGLSVGPRSSGNGTAGAQAPDEVLSDASERPAPQRPAGDEPIALTPVIGLPPGGEAAATTTAGATGTTSGGPATASHGPAAAGDATGSAAPAPRPTADALAREAGLAERATRSPGTTLRDAGRAVAELLPLPLPSRSFALPFGLLAALGAYLVVQRRFRPGSLPMSAAALPQQEGVRDRHRL